MEWEEEYNAQFDYLKLCSEIDDSRYTRSDYFDTSMTRAGTRIMYDKMFCQVKNFIIEQRKQAKLEVLDEVLRLDKVVMNDKAWIRLVDIEKVKSEL